MKKLIVAALSCLLVACASGPSVRPGEGLSAIWGESLPAPSPRDMTPEPDGYLIGPLDKLQLVVFGIEELSQNEIQVDLSGNVGVALIGTVKAAGKQPAALATQIAEGLSERGVRNPQVTINVVDTVSQVVAVEGEVREPGIFPVEGRMTLMRAIAKARGTSEFARMSDVLVYRTVDGQRMVGVYDLRALRAGTYADPAVYANDLIVVGDSPARRTFKTLVEGTALLSPLVILLTR